MIGVFEISTSLFGNHFVTDSAGGMPFPPVEEEIVEEISVVEELPAIHSIDDIVLPQTLEGIEGVAQTIYEDRVPYEPLTIDPTLIVYSSSLEYQSYGFSPFFYSTPAIYISKIASAPYFFTSPSPTYFFPQMMVTVSYVKLPSYKDSWTEERGVPYTSAAQQLTNEMPYLFEPTDQRIQDTYTKPPVLEAPIFPAIQKGVMSEIEPFPKLIEPDIAYDLKEQSTEKFEVFPISSLEQTFIPEPLLYMVESRSEIPTVDVFIPAAYAIDEPTVFSFPPIDYHPPELDERKMQFLELQYATETIEREDRSLYVDLYRDFIIEDFADQSLEATLSDVDHREFERKDASSMDRDREHPPPDKDNTPSYKLERRVEGNLDSPSPIKESFPDSGPIRVGDYVKGLEEKIVKKEEKSVSNCYLEQSTYLEQAQKLASMRIKERSNYDLDTASLPSLSIDGVTYDAFKVIASFRVQHNNERIYVMAHNEDTGRKEEIELTGMNKYAEQNTSGLRWIKQRFRDTQTGHIMEGIYARAGNGDDLLFFENKMEPGNGTIPGQAYNPKQGALLEIVKAKLGERYVPLKQAA